MTDEQIVKALECCGNMNECKKECPLGDVGGIDKCIHTLMLDALDLIKRQQAEIERLRTDLEDFATEYDAYKEAVEVALVETRAEAARECIKKIKSQSGVTVAITNDQELYETKVYAIRATKLDEILKEMTEERK